MVISEKGKKAGETNQEIKKSQLELQPEQTTVPHCAGLSGTALGLGPWVLQLAEFNKLGCNA